jgi:hypothetical protein
MDIFNQSSLFINSFTLFILLFYSISDIRLLANELVPILMNMGISSFLKSLANILTADLRNLHAS